MFKFGVFLLKFYNLPLNATSGRDIVSQKTLQGTVARRAGTLQACSAYPGRVYDQSVQSVRIDKKVFMKLKLKMYYCSYFKQIFVIQGVPINMGEDYYAKSL